MDEDEIEPSTEEDDIRGITMDEFDGFQVDKDQNLYWHGKPVNLKNLIEFSTVQAIFGFLAASGVFMGGLGALLKAFKS